MILKTARCEMVIHVSRGHVHRCGLLAHARGLCRLHYLQTLVGGRVSRGRRIAWAA